MEDGELERFLKGLGGGIECGEDKLKLLMIWVWLVSSEYGDRDLPGVCVCLGDVWTIAWMLAVWVKIEDKKEFESLK